MTHSFLRLTLSDQDKKRLRSMAAALGMTIGRGPMAEAGSIQQLVAAVADGRLVVTEREKSDPTDGDFCIGD